MQMPRQLLVVDLGAAFGTTKDHQFVDVELRRGSAVLGVCSSVVIRAVPPAVSGCSRVS